MVPALTGLKAKSYTDLTIAVKKSRAFSSQSSWRLFPWTGALRAPSRPRLLVVLAAILWLTLACPALLAQEHPGPSALQGQPPRSFQRNRPLHRTLQLPRTSKGRLEVPFMIATKLRGRSGEILGIGGQEILEIPSQTILGDLQIELRGSYAPDLILVKLSRGRSTAGSEKISAQTERFLVKRGSKLLTILSGRETPLEIVMQYGENHNNLDKRDPKSSSKDFFEDFLKGDARPNEKKESNPLQQLEPSPKIDFQKIEKWRRLKNWPKSKEQKSVQV